MSLLELNKIPVSQLDPAVMYRSAVDRYESDLCNFEELITYSMRLATVLQVAGVADPGLVSFMSRNTADKIRAERRAPCRDEFAASQAVGSKSQGQSTKQTANIPPALTKAGVKIKETINENKKFLQDHQANSEAKKVNVNLSVGGLKKGFLLTKEKETVRKVISDTTVQNVSPPVSIGEGIVKSPAENTSADFLSTSGSIKEENEHGEVVDFTRESVQSNKSDVTQNHFATSVKVSSRRQDEEEKDLKTLCNFKESCTSLKGFNIINSVISGDSKSDAGVSDESNNIAKENLLIHQVYYNSSSEKAVKLFTDNGMRYLLRPISLDRLSPVRQMYNTDKETYYIVVLNNKLLNKEIAEWKDLYLRMEKNRPRNYANGFSTPYVYATVTNIGCPTYSVDKPEFVILQKDYEEFKRKYLPTDYRLSQNEAINDNLTLPSLEKELVIHSIGNSDIDDISVKSFVLKTSESFDKATSLKIFITIDYNHDKVKLDALSEINFISKHIVMLSEYLKQFIVLDKVTVLHLDNDYTLKEREKRHTPSYECGNDVYVSNNLIRNVKRNLNVIITSHNSFTHNVTALKYVTYESQTVQISGMSHPLYDVHGYAFKMAQNKIVEANLQTDNLLNTGYVEKALSTDRYSHE